MQTNERMDKWRGRQTEKQGKKNNHEQVDRPKNSKNKRTIRQTEKHGQTRTNIKNTEKQWKIDQHGTTLISADKTKNRTNTDKYKQ